jgi:WD40 repeat protein
MDGAVALWDTSRVGRESGRPLELFRDFSAHDGGIFSMHWSRGGGILTSSKDGATCVSRLADDLGTVSLNDKKSNGVFVVERRIDDAHVGVVKCARWRMCPTLSSCGDGGDDALFATCGNDGRVCVLDKRAKRATVATLDDAHGGVAVNFLEWAAAASGPGVGSCVAENVFCTSASNDHRVLVWDLRFLTARVPLASLSGPHPAERHKTESAVPAGVYRGRPRRASRWSPRASARTRRRCTI